MQAPCPRFLGLAGALAALLAACSPSSSVAPSGGGTEPPAEPALQNILILLADDLGVDVLASYGEGSQMPHTPNLDALAASGVQFRNAWSNPVCSPTRAVLQTGAFSFRNGIGMIVEIADVGLPDEMTTLPEMLTEGTDGAYATGAFGKWHLAAEDGQHAVAPNAAGYDHFAGSRTNLYPHEGEDYFSWTKIVDGVESETEQYATSATVDDALAWIQGTEKPWLAYVAFHAPHNPFHAPPDDLHTMDLTGLSPAFHPRPFYEAMVQAVDTEIGRLFAGIGAEELANTTVIFLGDNGTPPSVTLPPFDDERAKGTLYTGGVNVPLIVSGPQVTQLGSESDALLHVADLYATIAEISGVDLTLLPNDPGPDSISFLPHLEDPALPSTRQWLYTEMFHPNGQPAEDGIACAPVEQLCQDDIGLGSPGSAVLSLCGPPLYGGYTATLRVEGGPPGGFVSLFSSDATAPLPLPTDGVWFVPKDPPAPITFDLDENGAHERDILGGLAFGTVYYQAVYAIDTDLNGEFEQDEYLLTNALRAEQHDTDIKAVRDSRYKLIRNAYTCEESLYDLREDRFEENDLLDAGQLDPEAATALAELRDLLDSIRHSTQTR
jgi:arylsulfatase A-like enzyme